MTQSIGGFTVGHNATVNFSKEVATILALKESDGRLKVTIEFETPQAVDAPEGATATRFEVASQAITSTWRKSAQD